MKTLFLAGLFAFLAALLIAGLFKPKPLEAQLMHLQLEQSMPEAAGELAAESAEMQALFLAYADAPVLLAKARLALLRYPDMARPVFKAFGAGREFQDVLARYGEDVILPIHYFLTHEIFTLELMRGLSDTARTALHSVRRLWSQSQSVQADSNGVLSAEERGRYAIQFLKLEGYDFLGQFVVSQDGQVGWVQTERVLEGINSFFASGVKGLETRLRRDETVELGDIGWAAMDVAIGVSAFKILRIGRVGSAGVRSLTFSQRTAALGSGLWRGSVVGARLVKYGAPAVLAYIAVRHPSVINSMLGAAAEKLGLPVQLVQIIGWTLVLLPIMLLLRFILRPLVWVIAGLVRLLAGLDRTLRGRTTGVTYRPRYERTL
ncbi:hypothetical protein PT7_3606 [Pusillimonas sp. T7-7]|uniref:hypothetical protein n=1 Tax=Pusillimonas sp. (strain T7-7) TaxID=1007105 RepID=UPI00020847C8|nr:hypothetical protein [Pusillimonas sp. T7-7]AEC22146.1 hypothetical protein PT7_3606 [Pusillimonas sp. T7-7]